MKRFFLILFLLLTATIGSWAQEFFDIVPPSPGTIEFVVNTNRVIQNEKYFSFIENVVPFVKEYGDRVKSITIVGSASPEGNKAHNIYLANIRADKIFSFISDYIPKSKIVVINDYDLFLEKTGLTEDDYPRLRAAYFEIEVWPKIVCEDPEPVYIKDTLYITDTLYIEKEPRIIPIVAFKTNLALDAILAPNIQAEVYTHLAGLSLEFDYTFPWYKIHDKYFYYQVLNGTAGIRKYFNNKYSGHYLGLYGNTFIYDICLFNKDKGWQGEGYGAGLTYGYVFVSNKSPRLKFECFVRLGWFYNKYDSYHTLKEFDDKYYYDWYGRVSDFTPRRFNMNYYGPTMIGFNITYDLICLRKY